MRLTFIRSAPRLKLQTGSGPEQQTKGNDMTNSINDAIASQSAHDLAEALASAGVSTTRSGALHSDEACDVDGYGTFFHDSGWQVRHLDGCDYPIADAELANELAEIVTMTKKVS